MNRLLRIACCGLLLFLTGCSSLQGIDSDWINSILYTPTPAPARTPTSTPQPAQTPQSATGQPQSSNSDPTLLRIWLPPQFNPNANNSAAALLKQRLNNFEAEHPGLEIDIRIKAEEGAADLLDALSITSMAAPDALPDLVALPRHALEAAAQKGLVQPMDAVHAGQNSDLYPYARELAKVDGTEYGIPFAGDASVIIYRPELVWIKTWDDILLSESHLIFAGADSQAELGLSLYASAGGELVDAQGDPMLDQEILTQVLELFAKGRVATLFPDAATNLSSDDQVLQEYRARRAEMAIVHYSSYSASQDGLLQPLMGLKEAHFTFADGRTWALAGQRPENQELARELADFLTTYDFLSPWIKEIGYLPTSVATTDKTDDSPIPAVIEAVQLLPSEETMQALGPLMQEAVTRVLNGEQPDTVARSVIEELQ